MHLLKYNIFILYMKTAKKRNYKMRTKKNKQSHKKTSECPIGLVPFEMEYLNKKSSSELSKLNSFQKKQFVKQLLSKFAPSKITPRSDFYSYVNYLWLKNIKQEQQQKYIVQIDDFRLAQDKVYQQLYGLINNYIKNNSNSRLAKNLKNFRDSVLSLNSKEYTRKLVKESIELVDNIIKENKPWKLLAIINSDEMTSPRGPFVWSVNPDNKNPKICRCYIDAHAFAILDLNVYYDDGTDVSYKNKYRKAFFSYTKKLFDTLIGKNNLNEEDPFNVEVDIFNALGCLQITRKSESTYNKVLASEAKEKYGFDWDEFSKELGFKTTPKYFITSSLNYLKCGTDLFLKNWNSSKWRTYWIWIFVRRLARITKDWQNITFDFYGKFQRGEEDIVKSPAVSAALYMSLPFNNFLTKQYVDHFRNPQAIEYVKVMCNDLKVVFQRILKRNKWLEPSTKQYALKKLDSFTFIYGVHDQIYEDPNIDYTTNLYDNIQKLMNWRHHKFIEMEGKSNFDLPMMDWTNYPAKMTGTQAYIVNASYTPTKNSIFINLGYIQQPFVDLEERGIEYNLAHLGFTIGHEMSHGFDDWGSQYGPNGDLHDWWTESDKKKFKAIQADVIKQYEQAAAKDGIIFDATIGIGEDLADISGLAICDEYLSDFHERNQSLIPIKNLSYQEFYTYFAFQQRQMVKKQALAAQLKTNPHPLDKYRTNCPLSRSEIFRALYNIKKGDDMWWHNTNTVWSN